MPDALFAFAVERHALLLICSGWGVPHEGPGLSTADSGTRRIDLRAAPGARRGELAEVTTRIEARFSEGAQCLSLRPKTY